jgi:aryl-alcohol dehydrogenase-like predicted oxidoreductase
MLHRAEFGALRWTSVNSANLTCGSPLCFGGNVFGWTVDERSSFALLDAFVASGMNFIDTADVYSRWKEGNQGGESETIIGNWLKSRGGREKLVIATKASRTSLSSIMPHPLRSLLRG